MNKKLLKILCSIALVAIIAACAITPLFTQAEMVEIEKATDCDLTYQGFDARFDSFIWQHEGLLTSDSSSKYILKSNGWAQWSTTDHLAFGYKKIAFNYSKKAQITAETTMTYWDGSTINAGAGIMFRSGLEADDPTIMLHFRPGSVMVTYRSTKGKDSSQGKTILMPTASLYPVTFKIVLVKGQMKATCYYKIADNPYSEFATVPFNYGSEIYAGISAYSQDPNFMATAKFSSFSYLVEAPEGYTVEGGDTSSTPSEEEKIELPEDLPVMENVLLRETFTDGSMTEKNEDKQNDITNPIWKSVPASVMDGIDIQLNESQTNRYIYEYIKDYASYYAGDQHWTDYKTSYDVMFTKEYSEQEANEFTAYLRVTDIAQYGFQYYFVSVKLLPVDNKVKITLGLSDAYHFLTSELNTYVVEVEEAFADDKAMDIIDKWQNLTVETFDNVITVYWNGKQVIKYTDEDAYMKTEGCIGFGSNGAAVKVDNITVTKLDDILGGDWDNSIAGSWNEDKPEYLDRFESIGAAH
ncbi:MAG: DUF1080 domain-containing protein [Clostridia bacterium]|nr:DUF1080 domain-containing protein [Clostridia bacterium]